MAVHYTIKQIMEVTGLSDSYIRKTLRKKKVEAVRVEKREKFYAADDIEQLFGKHMTVNYEPGIPEYEPETNNQIVLHRTEYETMIANLGILRGKLEELETSRQYWERDRTEAKRAREKLEDRIRELEKKIENFHEKELSWYQEKTPWWKRIFGG